YDLAYNLLMSCDRDGILITTGDNDTFPLWALQEAFGIRRDVRVVNLGLLGASWYAKELRHTAPVVALPFEDDYLDQLATQPNPTQDATPITMRRSGLHIVMPGKEQMPLISVQKQLLYALVDANCVERPFYFAMTVAPQWWREFAPFCVRQGLVYRLAPTLPAGFDYERTRRLLDTVYSMRRFGDPAAHLAPVSQEPLMLYVDCFIRRAYAVRGKLDSMRTAVAADTTDHILRATYETLLQETIAGLSRCIALAPREGRPRVVQIEMLLEHAQFAVAQEKLSQAQAQFPGEADFTGLAKDLARSIKKNNR
ncbi:MAG: hypothetical protein PHC61_10175, partial [Chitinivibrionales bacterium]|nr:hypothetical protein [Chitinivibrionales bacterium]